MDLKLKTEKLDAHKGADIARAAEILRNGGTVAFPTETVYGLGANALSAEAVTKIFEAKQRPSWDPLIVHISDRQMLAQIVALHSPDHEKSPGLEAAGLQSRHKRPDLRRASAPEGMPGPAAALMDAFWPGPLTLLLPRTAAIPDAVTAGRPLVGVRMPNHPVALELIRQAGVPIAAPSANTFGHTSPTTAEHVLADLDGRIEAILDGGPTRVGIESTVIGFDPESKSGRDVIIYRPGAITDAMLENVEGIWWVHNAETPKDSSAEPASLPSPGFGLRHYAPRAKLILVPEDRDGHSRRGQSPDNVLVDAIDQAFDGIGTVGVMLPDGWDSSCAQLTFPWGSWEKPEVLAQRVFAGLRELDDRGATVIICPLPESCGISEAIRDRLQKAAR